MANSHVSGPHYSTNGYVGNVTGNVTGNITGNITGNVTGNVTGNITGNMTGYRVGAVSASQSTIVAAAGASNTCTLTIQLKDGAGTNLSRVTPFDVYVSDVSTGIGISSTAASTGFSVASGGGVRLVTAVTKSIACVSSATGSCVLSLLDTAKTTYYVVVATSDGVKVSAQLTSGDYGA